MRQSNATAQQAAPHHAPRRTTITLLCLSLFALFAPSTPAHAQGTDPIVPRYPVPLTDAEIKAKDKAAKDAAVQAAKKAEQEKRDKAAVAASQQAANTAKAELEAIKKENAKLKAEAKLTASKAVPPAESDLARGVATIKEIYKQQGLLPSGAGAAAPALSYTLLTPYTAYPNGPKLVPLPQTDSTTMLLGDNNSNPSTEKPAYRVLVDYNLSIGQTEVTHAQWQACVDDKVCASVPDSSFGKGNKPVINVSFRDDKNKNDVTSYLRWLNQKAGIDANSTNRYRLPTEAEWEYAARAGGRGEFSLGKNNDLTLSDATANYDARYVYIGSTRGKYRERTIDVASLPNAANAWGLHDMHGNVLEWVADCYNSTAYSEREKVGGGWRADKINDESQTSLTCPRVYRGGSWYNDPQDLRSTNRDGFSPVRAYGILGFRLARTLP